jgi:hypothetical protein
MFLTLRIRNPSPKWRLYATIIISLVILEASKVMRQEAEEEVHWRVLLL